MEEEYKPEQIDGFTDKAVIEIIKKQINDNKEIEIPLSIIIENLKSETNEENVLKILDDLLTRKFSFSRSELILLDEKELFPFLISIVRSGTELIKQKAIDLIVTLSAKSQDISCLMFESGICKLGAELLPDPIYKRDAICIFHNIIQGNKQFARRVERILSFSVVKEMIATEKEPEFRMTLIRYLLQLCYASNGDKTCDYLQECFAFFETILKERDTELVCLLLQCTRKLIIENKAGSFLVDNKDFIDCCINLIGTVEESKILYNAFIVTGTFAKAGIIKTIDQRIVNNSIFYVHSPNAYVGSTAIWCLCELAKASLIENPVTVASNFITKDFEATHDFSMNMKSDCVYFISLLILSGSTNELSQFTDDIDVFKLFADFKEIENESTLKSILDAFIVVLKTITATKNEINIPEKLSEHEFMDFIEQCVDSSSSEISERGKILQEYVPDDDSDGD